MFDRETVFLYLKEKQVTINVTSIILVKWGNPGEAHCVCFSPDFTTSKGLVVDHPDDRLTLEEFFGIGAVPADDTLVL